MATARNIGVVSAPFYADVAMDDYQYYCARAASTAGYAALSIAGCAAHPIGVIQDNNASARGEVVQIGMFGPMVAKVAACDNAGNPCPIAVGHFLRVASTGFLIKAGSVGDVVAAMALQPITSSCHTANIEVFWYGIPGASATATS